MRALSAFCLALAIGALAIAADEGPSHLRGPKGDPGPVGFTGATGAASSSPVGFATSCGANETMLASDAAGVKMACGSSTDRVMTLSGVSGGGATVGSSRVAVTLATPATLAVTAGAGATAVIVARDDPAQTALVANGAVRFGTSVAAQIQTVAATTAVGASNVVVVCPSGFALLTGGCNTTTTNNIITLRCAAINAAGACVPSSTSTNTAIAQYCQMSTIPTPNGTISAYATCIQQ